MVSKQRWSSVFQIKNKIRQRYAKYELTFISAWPNTPWHYVQLFLLCIFVVWCSLPLQSCNYFYECVSTKHEIPLEAGSTLIALLLSDESRLCLWTVCVLLGKNHWGYVPGWPPRVAPAAFSLFPLKRTGCIHLFCIALGCEPQLGLVCCSCDLREWIFLCFF